MIYIGSDHAGFELKRHILSIFPYFTDIGTNSQSSCDYPIYAAKLCKLVVGNKDNLGILICGSGTGMSIAANKHKGIRAANCWTEEIAKLAREHNNANVLTLAARFLSTEQTINIIKAFISTDFSNLSRHIQRVNLLEI